jgi:hypothetical protein
VRDALLVAVLGIALVIGGSVLGRSHTPQPAEGGPPTTVHFDEIMALQPPTYPDGSLNPDYKDHAIVVLQATVELLKRELVEAREHDAAVHRGECIPWEKE